MDLNSVSSVNKNQAKLRINNRWTLNVCVFAWFVIIINSKLNKNFVKAVQIIIVLNGKKIKIKSIINILINYLPK